MGYTYSVVIPAYNEERRIGECLAAVYQGDRKPEEVIVADGGSTDKTVKIAESFGARVVENSKKHAAGGRNKGIKMAKGDVIVFLDADCIPEKGWLKNIAKAFAEEPDLDGLGGYIEPAAPLNRYEKFWGELSLKIVMSYGDTPYYVKEKTLNDAFITASCAYKRRLLIRLKGFSNFFANNAEDIDLCWRALDAGAKLKYVPDVRIKAHSPTDLSGIRKKSFRDGYSSSKLQKRYGGRVNYDLRIYKILFSNIFGMIRGKKDADLFAYETFWHLMGKYYGSIKVRVINV